MANNTPIAEDAAPTTLHGGPPDTCWPPDPFDWWPVIVAVLFVLAVLYI
jgi:hypothetical protein